MNIKRIIVCVLSVILISNMTVYAEPSVSAKSAILIEKDSGRVLYTHNCDERLPMASTTKIMTAAIAIDSAGDRIDEVIDIPECAVGVEGSSMYLQSGEKLSIRELLYGLMLSSGNDAAVAIAETVGGTQEDFVKMMNEKAAEIGAKDTHFVNPNGLPDESHYSTARDMANIAAYAMQNPIFSEIVATKSYTVQGEGKAYPRALLNHNKLLKMYDGCIGIKTGFVKVGGRCLVSAAERDGMTLICVTLNAPDDWNDHKNLFDYGFETYKRDKFIGTDLPVTAIEVDGAYDGVVPIYAERDVYYPVKEGEESIAKIEINEGLKAPLSAGEKVGRIYFEKTDGQGTTNALIEGTETGLIIKTDVECISPVKKFGILFAERLSLVFGEWAKFIVGEQ